MTSEVQYMSGGESEPPETTGEELYKIMDRLELYVVTVGCRLSGVDVMCRCGERRS